MPHTAVPARPVPNAIDGEVASSHTEGWHVERTRTNFSPDGGCSCANGEGTEHDRTVPSYLDATLSLGHIPTVDPRMTQGRSDALDLLGQEGEKLRDLFARWDTQRSDSSELGQAAAEGDPSENEQLVKSNFELGTIGKLLLEHAALYVAACEEVSRQLGPPQALKRQLDQMSEAARPLLDDLDERNRGIAAVSVVTPGFAETVERLRSVVSSEIGLPPGRQVINRLDALLGPRRGRLRSARFVTRHAPTHPGPRRWYSRIPAVLWVQSLYDRVRGCPWAESTSWADRELAERYRSKP